MKHYIDKDALVAEIDRQKIGYNLDGKHSVEYNTVKKILNILDSLEVKDVDLEKEIDEVIHNYKLNNYRHTSICSADIEWIAEHFFELGLKAQKGK